jgi:hypothetical protein
MSGANTKSQPAAASRAVGSRCADSAEILAGAELQRLDGARDHRAVRASPVDQRNYGRQVAMVGTSAVPVVRERGAVRRR